MSGGAAAPAASASSSLARILEFLAELLMLVGLVLGTIWVVVLIEGVGVSNCELESERVVRMRICGWGETQLEGPGKPVC